MEKSLEHRMHKKKEKRNKQIRWIYVIYLDKRDAHPKMYNEKKTYEELRTQNTNGLCNLIVF